jgi:hypothetical protein
MSKPKAIQDDPIEVIHLHRLANKAVAQYRNRLIEEAERTGDLTALMFFSRQCMQLGAMTIARAAGPIEAAEAAYRVADDFAARSLEEDAQ